MLSCPFCGQDYSDVGLREGRCPYCGGVLAWDEGGDGDSPQPQPASGSPLPVEPPRPRGQRLSDVPPLRAPEPSGYRPPEPSGLPAPKSYRSPTPPWGAGYGEQDADRIGSDTPRAGGATEHLADEPRGGGAAESDEEPSPTLHRAPTPDLVSQHIEPRQLTQTDLEKMSAIWNKTISPQITPQMTIKAETRVPAIRESRLVIQQRAVRPKAETELPSSERPDYELLEVIGEGGVGVVYAARQASIDRTVAVKMLRPEITDHQEHQEKFLAEAVVTGDLDHPNIVPIYDLGSNQAGALFYSMKRVQGTPWLDVIQAKKLPENLDILLKVCDAIAFAHARGVIHRDLKPENIMLGSFGEVLVMDWGIAMSTSLFLKHGTISQSTSMGGTPAYMAPEMATGPIDAIGPESDVYLLGGLLYEVLTGNPPHHGKDVAECLEAAAHNRIQPTRKRGELMEIALRAMATNPSHRYPSVQAFQAAIREYQSHSESVLLSDRAEQELKQAEQTGDYQDFARAMFGFQEALELWDRNERAREGATTARLAYARRALRQEDFDLGITLLDEGNPQHRDLLGRLKAGRAARNSQQQRVRQLRGVAALLGLLIVLGAGGAAIWMKIKSDELFKANAELTQRERELKEANEGLAVQTDVANSKTEEANKNAIAANKAKQEAMANAQRAWEQRNAALVQTNLATRTAYRAAIAAAAVRINSDPEAGEILSGLREKVPQLLHFEWGRLNFLATRRSVATPPRALVEAMSVSPDGRYVVAGSSDGTATVWQYADARQADRTSGLKLVATLQHGSPVRAVAFDPQGQRIALGGGDDQSGTISIWDVAQLKPGMNQPAETYGAGDDGQQHLHGQRVTSIQFSHRDPNCLLTASQDRTARIWYLSAASSSSEPQVLKGHVDVVWTAAFSSDDRWVVTASEDGTVRIWEAESGFELQRFREHKGPVYTAAFAPRSDTLRVASAGFDERILVWTPNVDTVLEIAESRSIPADRVFLTSLVEGARKAVGKRDEPSAEQISQQLARTSLNLVVLNGHSSSVRTLQFSGNGKLLLSGGDDTTLRLWDPAWTPNRPDPQSPGSAGPASDAADPLLARLRQQARTRVRLAERNAVSAGDWLMTLNGHGSSVTACQFARRTAGGELLVSGSFDGTVRWWDLDTTATERVFQAGEQAMTGAVLTDDNRYVLAAAEDGLAYLFDASNGQQLASLSEGHKWLATKAFYFQQDGQWRLLTSAGDSSVRIWNVDTGTELQVKDQTGNRGLLAMSADGRYFATGSTEKTVRIWDAHTLEPIHHLLEDQQRALRDQLKASLPKMPDEERERQVPDVTCVAFSPDNKLVFLGDTKGTCYLLDVSTGQEVRPAFPGHTEVINAAAFTSDGRLLLTASDDGTVATWDVATGTRVGNALQHTMALSGTSGSAQLQAPVKQLALIQDGQGRSIIYTAAPSEVEVENNRPTRPTTMRVRRWVLGSQQPTASLDLACDRLNSMAFSTDLDESATLLLACSRERTDFLMQWDPAAGPAGRADQARKVWDDNLERGAIAWAVFASGSRPGILTVGGKGARLWSLDEGRRILSYRPHAAVRAVDVAPVGVKAEPIGPEASGSYLLKWTAENAEQGGGQILALTAGDDNSAKIWQVQIGDAGEVSGYRAIARFDWGNQRDPAQRGHTQPVNSARFVVEGERVLVVTASDDGTAKIWHQNPDNPASAPNGYWEVRATFAGHQGRLHAVAISPDCRYLATAGDDGLARLWRIPLPGEPDAETPLAQTEPFREAVLCLAFSPDCRWLVTGGGDFVAHAWRIDSEAGTLQKIGEMRGHFGAVRSVTFSADAHRIVTASEDGTIRVWNTFPLWTNNQGGPSERLDEVLNLTGHKRGVNSVAFTPDGTGLLSSSDDGRAILWFGEFVEPAIRLSDMATRYVEGGVPVDPELLVTQPSRVQDQPPPADYRVVMSIRSETEEEIPLGAGEVLNLSPDDQVIQLQGDESGPQQVLWRDPATNTPRLVGVLARDGATLTLRLATDASSWSVQAALRRITYRNSGQRTVDLTRQVRFELWKNDQPLTADAKMVSIDANVATTTGPAATAAPTATAEPSANPEPTTAGEPTATAEPAESSR